jgi:hypothetical protein
MGTSTFCSLHSVTAVTVTVVRQIADVPAAILEVFHPTLHIAATHAGISTDMTKLIKYIRSSTVLLYKEFNHGTLMIRYIIVSHFVAVDYGKVFVGVCCTCVSSCRKGIQLLTQSCCVNKIYINLCCSLCLLQSSYIYLLREIHTIYFNKEPGLSQLFCMKTRPWQLNTLCMNYSFLLYKHGTFTSHVNCKLLQSYQLV